MTPKLNRAIQVTSRLYKNHLRRSDNETPYITHFFSVAWILANYSNNEDIIIAGLFHDILNDTPYSAKQMEKDFGAQIRKIVCNLASENKRHDPKIDWQKKKETYLQQLKNASTEGLLVAAADKYHNLFSLIQEYQLMGEKLWKCFRAPKEKQFWFYNEVLKILEKRLPGELTKACKKSFKELQKIASD